MPHRTMQSVSEMLRRELDFQQDTDIGSDDKDTGDRKSWKSGTQPCLEYLHMRWGSRGFRESLAPDKGVCHLGDGEIGAPDTVPGEYISYFLTLAKKWGPRHRASAGTLSLAA